MKYLRSPFGRTSHIYRLYLYWCYQIGILPKGTRYKPTSPFLREELRRLDLYDRETRFLASSGIETLEELQTEIGNAQSELAALCDERKHLTCAMRRADPERKTELQAQKAELTKRITPLRDKLRLMRNIERRSEHIDQTLTRVYESAERNLNRSTKPKTNYKKERTYER